MLMILAGRAARGTEACCLAATDPECLRKLSSCLADEKVDLHNYRDAFCAVVSICAKKKRDENGKWELDPSLGPDSSTFRVEDLSVYK